MARRISILGATGSIGSQTLDVLRFQNPEDIDIVALSAGRNVAALAEAAIAFRADIAVIAEESRLEDLRAALSGHPIEAAAGDAALNEAASRDTDWTMSAIVGAAGLAPTLAAARATRHLALANKESLVCAGALLLDVVKRSGATLLPVDSEHSAIFQALGSDQAPISRILLTASGGPFRTWDLNAMAKATPEQAAAHPNWDMGLSISIDSASMFNKALEIIEAQILFKVPAEAVEVVVHPQSIVHSLVEFIDGSQIAQLGVPDMRGAIGFALNWPDRQALPVPKLDLAALGTLTFEPPDEVRFPALRLAREAASVGGLMGSVLNGAKEAAMQAFVDRKIGFLDMAPCVEQAMQRLSDDAAMSSLDCGLRGVLKIDRLARDAVWSHIAQRDT